MPRVFLWIAIKTSCMSFVPLQKIESREGKTTLLLLAVSKNTRAFWRDMNKQRAHTGQMWADLRAVLPLPGIVPQVCCHIHPSPHVASSNLTRHGRRYCLWRTLPWANFISGCFQRTLTLPARAHDSQSNHYESILAFIAGGSWTVPSITSWTQLNHEK